MKLITLVQVSDSTDEEQGIIAKLLMVCLLTMFRSHDASLQCELMNIPDLLPHISCAFFHCSWQLESSTGGRIEGSCAHFMYEYRARRNFGSIKRGKHENRRLLEYF